MSVIIPPLHAQTTLSFSSPNYEGQDAASVLGFRSADSLSLVDLNQSVASAWSTTISGLQDNSVTLVSVVSVTAQLRDEQVTDIAGTRSSESPPPNVSLLVSKVTSERGRRAQGRWYPPGLISQGSANESGIIDTGPLGDIQAGFSGFLTSIETAGYFMVVLQNDEGETPPLDPPPLVTALDVDDRVATQRRRLR